MCILQGRWSLGEGLPKENYSKKINVPIAEEWSLGQELPKENQTTEFLPALLQGDNSDWRRQVQCPSLKPE